LNTETHLHIAKTLLYDHYLPQVNLHEFFMADSAEVIEAFEKKVMSSVEPQMANGGDANEGLALIPDPQWRRFKATVDLDLALKLFNVQGHNCKSEEER